jgi:hypothetical protein
LTVFIFAVFDVSFDVLNTQFNLFICHVQAR